MCKATNAAALQKPFKACNEHERQAMLPMRVCPAEAMRSTKTCAARRHAQRAQRTHRQHAVEHDWLAALALHAHGVHAVLAVPQLQGSRVNMQLGEDMGRIWEGWMELKGHVGQARWGTQGDNSWGGWVEVTPSRGAAQRGLACTWHTTGRCLRAAAVPATAACSRASERQSSGSPPAQCRRPRCARCHRSGCTSPLVPAEKTGQ